MTEFKALASIFIGLGGVCLGVFSVLISMNATAEIVGIALVALIGAGSFASSSVVMHYGAKRREAEERSHKPPLAG